MKINDNEDLGEPYLNHKVDKELHNNPEIKFGDDRSISYQEIQDNFPINKFDKTDLLIMWDDVLQFTSLGLMEVLNNLYKLKIPVIPEHFFMRPNKFCNGMDYIYEAYSKHLTKEQIDGVKQKYYWKILQLSLKSTVFQSINRIYMYLDKLTFIFPFEFPELQILVESIKQTYKNNTKLKISYVLESEKSFTDIVKEIKPNAIISRDINEIYLSILENKLKRVAIIGPNEHNNIDEALFNELLKFEKKPLPNFCSLDVYTEQYTLPSL